VLKQFRYYLKQFRCHFLHFNSIVALSTGSNNKFGYKLIILMEVILKKIACICIVSIFSHSTFAQNVGISSNGAMPDPSAMLDIISESRGMLVPRMSLQKRDLIANPANGLLIYQNTDVPGFYYYDQPEAKWKQVGDNLGNHTLLSNLVMGTRYLSKNGDNLGMQFTDDFGSLRFRSRNSASGLPGDLLKLDNDGSFVIRSTSIGYGSIPASGPGLRLMWYNYKGAFRAGEALTNQWDDANIGYYSWAGGVDVMASGTYSFAQGNSCRALNTSAVALGGANNSLGVGSFSVGLGNYANAYGSAAIGMFNDTVAADRMQFKLTDPVFTVGIGTANNARKNALSVLKNGKTGIGVTTPKYMLDVFGRQFLRHSGDGSAGIWYSNSNNVEAVFAGMKTNTQWGVYGSNWQFFFDISNGEAYKTSGSTAWIIASDARLKEEVHPYTDGLNEVMKIEPVWFKYKENSGFNTSKAYPGVVAQDLQQVAPYMVGNFEKDGEEFLNVDNSAMTYMLINSIKELKSEIETLKKEVAVLRKKK
jgi:hypothetical protein